MSRLRGWGESPYAAPALVSTAFLLALATQMAYATDVGLPARWLGFVVAGVLFAAGAWASGQGPAREEPVREGFVLTRRQEMAALAAVLVLAAFFRFFRFMEFPPGLWFDEAINGTDALSIIDRDHLTVWRESNFGHSTIFFYLLIASFKFFGFTLFAMRVVPALAGLAAVFAFYFLARWLAGPVPALIATALLACGRWAVTFSRISWEASLMPVLEIMAVFFLVRALETRNRFYYFMAGGSLAAGIYTYLAFRFVPFVAVFLLLYVLVTEWRLIRSNIAGLVIYAASFAIVIFPLAQFAVQNQDQFLERTRAINVFREVDQKNSWEPLRYNIRASLGMMNVAGDKNGRHNIPGYPMLDEITGVLFVLGAAASLWGFRSWRRGHIAGWYALILIPGALTISIENPSAIRVIGAIPPIYLFVALAMGTMQRSFARVRYGAQAFLALAAMLVVSSVGINYYDFFHTQYHNEHVYEEFTPVYTQVGEIVAAHAPDERVWVSRDYEGHPAVRVLSRGKRYTAFGVAKDLMLSRDRRDALVIADSLQFAAIPTLKALYPNMTQEDYVDPYGRVFFTRLHVPADDTDTLHRIPVTVSRGVERDDAFSRERIDREWTEADLARGPLTVTWSGHYWSSAFPGQGSFDLTVPGTATIAIDGRTFEATAGHVSDGVVLPTGEHDVTITATIMRPGKVDLFFRSGNARDDAGDRLYWPSVGDRGFRVLYRQGDDFSVAPETDLGYVPFAAPVDSATTYRAIEYQGVYQATEAGKYGFAIEGGNSAQVFVDEQIVADNGGSHANRRTEGEIELGPGPHQVSIQYTIGDRPNWALSLRRPGGDWVSTTGDEFTPPAGAYTPPALVSLRNDAAWNTTGTPSGVGKLRAVAVRADGGLIAASSSQVAFLASTGALERTIDTDLKDIFDIAAARDGGIYVLDRESRTLLMLNADGSERRRLTGAFDSAWGVGAYEGGALVASPAGGIVYRVPNDGDPQKLKLNDSEEKAKQPSDIDAGDDGVIYIADFERKRIVVSPDGENASSFASVGGTGAQLPHIAVRGKLIFVTDPVNQRVLAYDRAGKQRGVVVFPTTREGLRPVGIAASDDAVYVVDLEGGGLLRLALEIPPETAAELP